jgi:hypothetical protein
MNLTVKQFYNILLFSLVINCNIAIATTQTIIDRIPEATTKNTGPFIFKNYKIHFSTFNTTFLSPEIAKAYNITRSGKYAMVNISVHKVANTESDLQKTKFVGCKDYAIKAKVTGTKTNLLSQKTKLVFREIIEDNAIYYLAEIKITDKEYFNFELQVIPEGEQKPLPIIKTNQVFYIEH